jgi:hypothetical protein
VYNDYWTDLKLLLSGARCRLVLVRSAVCVACWGSNKGVGKACLTPARWCLTYAFFWCRFIASDNAKQQTSKMGAFLQFRLG